MQYQNLYLKEMLIRNSLITNFQDKIQLTIVKKIHYYAKKK